jgi:tRNA (mo5U34)-methyltransferase
MDATDIERLRGQVAAMSWYHTIELAPGVVTPGWFDTRAVAPQLPWPSLTGLRCLDVGTFDGFWAFEMERRGGSDVLAIDIVDPAKWDWPANSGDAAIRAIAERKGEGSGFELASSALSSSVKRELLSVYDLNPDDVGTFDFVYVGSLLLHLRDPVRALERVRSVCEGTLLLVDAIDLFTTTLLPRRPMATLDGIGRPWWWKPNVAGLVRMVESAGFKPTGKPHRFFMPPGPEQPRAAVSKRALVHRGGREAAMRAWRGDPHAAVVATAR